MPKKNMGLVLQFATEIKDCFAKSNGCHLPQPPPPSAGPSAVAAFETCVAGVQNNPTFQSCVKNNGFDLSTLPKALAPSSTGSSFPGGFGGQQGIYDKFFPDGKFDPNAAKQFVSGMCNSTDSANALMKCTFGAVNKNNLPILFSLVQPIYAICNFTGACLMKSTKITTECAIRLNTIRQDICKCKPEAEAIINSNDQCAAFRQNAFAFDICSPDPEKKCVELQLQVNEISKHLAS